MRLFWFGRHGAKVEVPGNDIYLGTEDNPNGVGLEVASSTGIFINDTSDDGIVIQSEVGGGGVSIYGVDANVILAADAINLNGTELGFFGHNPAARPSVPGSPTAQNIVDALVALGLVTQA